MKMQASSTNLERKTYENKSLNKHSGYDVQAVREKRQSWDGSQTVKHCQSSSHGYDDTPTWEEKRLISLVHSSREFSLWSLVLLLWGRVRTVKHGGDMWWRKLGHLKFSVATK